MRRAAVVVAGLIGALGLLALPGTTAAFTDPATARSGTFGGANLTAPSGVTCRSGFLGSYVDLTWTPTMGTDHRISITDGTATKQLGRSAAGVTTWRVNAGDAAVLPTGYLTAQVRAAAGDSWVSDDVATVKVRRYFDIVFLRYGITC